MNANSSNSSTITLNDCINTNQCVGTVCKNCVPLLEKAIKKAFELVTEGKLPIEDAAIATKILWEEYKKEIWLMGPVPMKKGYKAPTVNMNFLNDL